MKAGENFIQQLVLDWRETKRSQHAEFLFILVLHVKIDVIQSLRKADYGGASLNFAIFRYFVLI